MLNSIVHIKSSNKENRSFGTGFVIDNNHQGLYILTCEHVLGAVQEAVVESQPVEIIAISSFLDMAIIFLPSLNYKKVTLQLDNCPSLRIKTIAYSSFKEDLVQKNTIHATLFKDFIELHSTTDNSFYLIKKIKADKDYSFSKGNSGAPIICKQTGNVIAMLSNKRGDDIGYAIGVSCTKKLLEQLYEDKELLKKHQLFYDNLSTFTNEVNHSIEEKKSSDNKTIYNIHELEEEKKDIIQQIKLGFFKLKYFILGILTVLAIYGLYSFFNQEKIKTEEYYHVTRVPSTEPLNVRKGEGVGYKIIYKLPYNTTHIKRLHCKYNDSAKKWCKIKYKNITGWVNSAYIEKDTP